MAEAPLSLEYVTLLGDHPLELIRIAAAVGCTAVSLGGDGPPGASWSLLGDPALRREVRETLDGCGVTATLLDGMAVTEDEPVERHRRGFELAAELGVPRVNAFSRDPDLARTAEAMGRLAAMAAEYDIIMLIEPCPVLPVDSVATASALVGAIGLPNVALLVDLLHVARAGEAAGLAELDPALVGYVHVCDAPRAAPPTRDAYLDQARHDRLVPGEGELPVVDMLSALPTDVVVGVEVPLRARREAGVPAAERARLAVDGARRVLRAARARST